jgi:hypothetical protein
VDRPRVQLAHMGRVVMLSLGERLLVVLTAISIMICQTGCHKQFSVSGPPSLKLMSQSKYKYEDYQKDLEIYNGNLTKDPALAKQIRDKIAYGFMGEIDDAYGYYTRNLYAGKGLFGVSGDTTELGLTAAATIATHAPTKTLLSALATGITGVNLSFDKNFFAQQTFQAIGIAMQTRRDKARAEIIDHLDDPVDDYPLEAARRDLVSYYYAGTLPGGLQELQEEAGKAAAAQPPTTLH